MAFKSITVTNFLGMKEATIPLPDHPAAVTGPNSSGKTSIATAVAGLMSRNPNPLGLGLTKRPYMHEDADNGEVCLRDDKGTELARWVLGERSIRVFSECPEPYSVYPLSMEDFIGRTKPSERVSIWEPIFLPEPEDLIEELTESLKKSIPRDKQVQEVLDTLRKKGWSDAEKLFKEQATQGGRDWKRITGASGYGPVAALKWQPSGWQAKFLGKTVLECEAELELAREAVSLIQVSKAVTELELEKSQSARTELPAAKEDLNKATDEFKKAAAACKAVVAKASEVRNRGVATARDYDAHRETEPKSEDGVPCPDCGKVLVVMPDGSLRLAEDGDAIKERHDLWKQGLAARAKKLEDLRDIAKGFNPKTREARQAQSVADFARTAASDRVTRLNNDIEAAAGGQEFGDQDEANLARAQQEVENSREALGAVKKMTLAAAAHQSASEYSMIAAALGPKGVRAKEILKGIIGMHGTLKEMTDLTGWPLIELDKSYAVYVNSRPAVVSSESEKWRAQFLLQCAIGVRKESPLVIADGADILDSHNFAMLAKLCDWLSDEHGMHSLVCGTHLSAAPESWSSVELA